MKLPLDMRSYNTTNPYFIILDQNISDVNILTYGMTKAFIINISFMILISLVSCVIYLPLCITLLIYTICFGLIFYKYLRDCVIQSNNTKINTLIKDKIYETSRYNDELLFDLIREVERVKGQLSMWQYLLIEGCAGYLILLISFLIIKLCIIQ